MAQGFNPYIAEWSPYHGAAYAVIEATARLVAAGANWSKARFSYQEYFERMDKQAERFGQPVAALLGSIEAQIQLGLPSIGGKDSMSGTFEELTVPPTLVAFGVTTADSRKVLSPAALNSGERILRLSAVVTPEATKVGGTVNSSKVPDIESLPPIDGKPS